MVLIYSFLQPDSREIIVPVSKDGEELPRTYVDAAYSWSYDKKGMLTHMIQADRLRYFTSSDESHLQKPRFFSRHDNDTTWSAFADVGKLLHSVDKLELNNDVVLLNDTTKGQLETESMLIDIKRQVATSEVPITFNQDSNSMRADSMVTNLRSKQLRLRGHVEGVYVSVNQP